MNEAELRELLDRFDNYIEPLRELASIAMEEGGNASMSDRVAYGIYQLGQDWHELSRAIRSFLK